MKALDQLCRTGAYGPMNSDITTALGCGWHTDFPEYAEQEASPLVIWPRVAPPSIASPAVDQSGDERAPDRLPGISAEERLSWQRFLDAATAIHEAINAALVKAHQLTLFDVHVLHTLHISPGGSARMGLLSEVLLLLPSRLSQQVGRLEKQGLVRRDRSSQDKRVVIARITPQGRARLQPALRTYARELRRSYLGPLSRQQMTALGAAARKVSDALKASGESPGF